MQLTGRTHKERIGRAREFWEELEYFFSPFLLSTSMNSLDPQLSIDSRLLTIPPLGRHYLEVWEELDQLKEVLCASAVR
jgi:hypothetical protein